ncbi:MAG: cytochrome c biogenesis protein ResB [Deltaproteobacteria bacterium]|nr:cytochrome c biogenesis protein ResB [Deltaproteobacteria bacterium]
MPEKAKEAAGEAQIKARWRAAGSKVWYFFNSLKLTLSILITLAIVSIFGTVVEQNLPIEDYLSNYGEKWTKAILYLRLNDMYHSYWFTALLAMLATNIIVCTFERFPPKWKSLLNHKSEKFDSKLIEKFTNHQTFSVAAAPDAVKERVVSAFKKKRYGIISSGGDGEWRLYAWKGRIGRLGSDMTHISLLLILLGAIVGSFAGYKDFRAIFVGGDVTVPNEGFKLKLDKFWIDYYDSGQIKQYNSLVTVIEGGKEVLQKQIWVNEPLYYKGIRFYQSSYGTAWNRVEEAQVALKLKNRDNPGDPVAVKWQELKAMPGSPYSVKLVSYSADFAYDEKTNTVFSKSAEANNPAVQLEIYNGEKLVSTPWLFLKYPGIFPAIPNSDVDMVFLDFRGTMYSGLSINKDPGTNIVWAGTIVMGFGFILAFFVYHRRVWIIVRNTGRSSEVKLGGTINKNNFVFEKELKEIVEAVSASKGE